MGTRYPRFDAENVTQVAGSYGGIAYMVMAVLFIVVEIALLAWPSALYLWYQYREIAVPTWTWVGMAGSFAAAIAVSLVTFRVSMAMGVRALEELG